MTRAQRIAVELLGPPLLGTLLVFSGGWLISVVWPALRDGRIPEWGGVSFDEIGVGLTFAYMIAGIPSAFYTLIMERRFSRGLVPGSWGSVRLSAGLGALSGIAISLVFGELGRSPMSLIQFGGIGITVGFLLGFLIRRFPEE